MHPLEASARLRSILERTGVGFADDGYHPGTINGDGTDWQTVWVAFCELALEPADEEFSRHGMSLRIGDDSDCDLLLHESHASFDGSDTWEVSFTRQFTFEDPAGDYAGMNSLTLTFECPMPEGKPPRAQRWGYAGRKRDSVSDETHPEMRNWAGYVTAWVRAVEGSRSFMTMQAIGPRTWRCLQEDI